MRSYASIKGHPLHPALIVYPFGFLTGAFWFNAAASATGRRELRQVADHLVPAGVVAGLVAAVPGILDYLNSVPPQSSGRERATKHALLNTAALGLFAGSWLLGRRRGGRARVQPAALGALPFAMQAVGTAAMSVAGYMGGTLVYRNQIGVDHRYAGAGKWQEESREQRGPLALTTAAASLDVNQMKLVHAEGERIAVARTETGCAAFQDRCTHKGGPLSDGVLINGVVQCPWHGSQFDVHTGQVKCGPAEEPIATYEIANTHRIAR